jgi:flagellar hook assembly protein FlgD/fibronectin type 3 domain-containing protein
VALALAAVVAGTTAVQAVSLPPEVSVSPNGNQQFSPNGDGQEDATSVAVCLSSAANVTARVVDATSAVVRALAVGRSYPSGCSYLDWDGLGDDGAPVPDGRYAVQVSARNDAPQESTASLPLAVDRQVPGAITSPAPEAALGGPARIVFTPRAGVEVVNVQFVMSAPAGYCTTPAISAPEPDGSLAYEWDTAECGDGARSLYAHAQWVDVFGARHTYTTPTQSVSLLNPTAPVASLALSGYRQFSPGPAGIGEATTVRWCAKDDPTTGDVRSVVEVVDVAGARIRLLDDVVRAPSLYCGSWWTEDRWQSWDGADDAGQQVPDGVYSIRMTSTDGTGLSGSSTVDVVVDRRPVGSVTAPADGAVLRGATDLVFTPAAGADITRVRFALVSPTTGQGCWPDVLDSPAEDGTWTLALNTADCGDGARRLDTEVIWTDSFGATHSRTWSRDVVLSNPAGPVVTASALGTTEFAPGAVGRDEGLTVQWCASDELSAGDLQVSVQVLDAAGRVVRILRDEVRAPQRACDGWWGHTYEYWDGRDDDGGPLPDGQYTVSVTATDPTGLVGAATTDTVRIDRRVPGAITSPAAGAVLSGSTDFVFTPRQGLELDQVQFILRAPSRDCATTVFDPGADGLWRLDLDTATCGDGARQLLVQVYWNDQAGRGHGWVSPAVDVELDNVVDPSVFLRLPGNRVFSPGPEGRDDSVGVSWCNRDVAGDRELTTRVEVLDAAGEVVRVLRDEPTTVRPVCDPYWGSYLTYDSWDGADDAGQQVAEGSYSFRVTSTDAQGRTGTATSDVVVVDRRLPGELVGPVAGATVAGTPAFVFRPTEGIAVQRVDYSLGGLGFTAYNASPDGTWSTTQAVGSLPAGPASLTWNVTWLDQFGAPHSWSQVRQVAVDPTAVPLSVEQRVVSGQAPFDAELTVRASDPNGADLRVDVDWGDGRTEQRSITAPYEALELTHRYERPGAFRAFVSVSNGAGGYASQSIPMTASGRPNAAPQVEVSTSPTTGTAPLDTVTTITATDADGDPLTYRVDPGDGTSVLTGALPAAGVAHRFEGAGTYLIRVQVSDGALSVVRYVRLTVGLSEPLRAEAGDAQRVVVGSGVRLDAAASGPSAGITSFSWDPGDGSGPRQGALLDHVYGTVGTYTATLTVRSGAQAASDTVTITVTDPPPARGLTVSVTGNGSPLAGASLVAILPDGTRVSGTSGGSGTALLPNLPDGSVTAYVSAPGHRPDVVTGTLADGVGSASIDLVAGEAGVATVSSRPMTIEEIVAAGIDPAAPENQHVYEAEIHLYFEPVRDEPAMQVVVTENGVGCLSDCPETPPSDPAGCGVGLAAVCYYGPVDPSTGFGSDVYYPQVQYVQGAPVIQWLVLPIRASWLKEFFTVDMVIQNLSGVTFTQGSASLVLPAGLSLAPTAAPQSASRSVADIPARGSATLNWVVRGDVEGEYPLTADYVGVLAVLDEPIHLRVQSVNPLKVWGASALETTILVDTLATRWGPYRIDMQVINTSPVPVYNMALTMGEQLDPLPAGSAAYSFVPLTQRTQTVAEIPGCTTPPECPAVTASWTLFAGLGNDDVTQLRVVTDQSFVRQVAGDVDLAPVIKLRCPAGAQVGCAQRPVGSAPTVQILQRDGTDEAVVSWAAPTGLSGREVVGYEVWTRQDRESGGTEQWRPLPSPLRPQISADGGRLVIPSTQRTIGRYYAVRTVLDDGSAGFFHPIGTGPSRYVALGDSFSSGEGVPVFEPNTDEAPIWLSGSITEWMGLNTCHRSARGSYSRILSASPPPGTLLEPATFAACSGAVTADLLEPNAANPGEPAQVDAVNDFTDLVTLTMGGNDVDFAGIAGSCMLGNCTAQLQLAGFLGSNPLLSGVAEVWDRTSAARQMAEDCANPVNALGKIRCAYSTVLAVREAAANVDDGFSDIQRDASPRHATDGELRARLALALDRISQHAPNAQIRVLLYPEMIGPDNSSTSCQLAPLSALTGLAELETDERAALRALTDELNDAVRLGAADANAAAAADGRGRPILVVEDSRRTSGPLCRDGQLNGADSHVNGLVDPFGITGARGSVMYSLHPNALGQQAYAAALRQSLTPPVAGLLTQVELDQGETMTVGTMSVQRATALRMSVAWPGSTVGAQVIGPDGVVRAAGSPGVSVETTETSLVLEVDSPDDGTWTLQIVGEDVDSTGEPVTVSAWQVDQPVRRAAVTVTASRSDETAPTFDLVAGGGQSGATYTWVFSDGSSASGSRVTHTFAPTAEDWWASVEVRGADGVASWGGVAIGGRPRPPAVAEPVLPVAVVGTQWGVVLAATGNPRPSFSVVSGALPDGIVLDAATGLLGGVPTRGGSWTFTVAATNSEGQATTAPLTLVVQDGPALVDAAPPTELTAGIPVDYAFTATGSPVPTFAVEGTLPAGLALGADGHLTGTPTRAGSSTWTVVASNVVGSVRSATWTSTVAAADPTPPAAPAGAAVDGGADVSWTASANSGGSDVTGYAVTAAPGGSTCTTTGALTCRVTGLDNGTAYTFTVRATNAAGRTSAASAPSAAVIPVGVPGAPSAVAVATADRSLDVDWRAPQSTGGAPVTGYVVTTVPASAGCEVTARECSIAGLVNGTSYAVTVTAVTAGGRTSAAPVVGVPAGAPDSPTDVAAVAQDGALAVSWQAPADTNGAPVTGYTATASPGGATCTTTTTACTLDGLSNGVSYTVRVTATSGPSRTSAPSRASASAVPVSSPAAPGAVSATPGDTTADVIWTAPAYTGGAAVREYVATVNPGGQSCTATTTGCRIDGLVNGRTYTVSVVAINAAGLVSQAGDSAPVVPLGAPAAPRDVTAVRGDGQVAVSWTATVDGTRRATVGYRVTATPGGASCTTTTTSCTVTGLTNGEPHTFTVRALDAAGGTGDPVSSAPVRPVGAPLAVTDLEVRAADGELTARWTAPASDGGEPLAGYRLIADPTDLTGRPDGPPLVSTTCPTTTCRVEGLVNGTAYAVSVTAVNGAGLAGPTVSTTARAVPVGAPAAPTVLSAVGGDGQATVTFSAVQGNGAPIRSYSVAAEPADGFCTATAELGCTIRGLTNGQTYRFVVRATNTAGLTSPASAFSGPVTPTAAVDPDTGGGTDPATGGGSGTGGATSPGTGTGGGTTPGTGGGSGTGGGTSPGTGTDAGTSPGTGTGGGATPGTGTGGGTTPGTGTGGGTTPGAGNGGGEGPSTGTGGGTTPGAGGGTAPGTADPEPGPGGEPAGSGTSGPGTAPVGGGSPPPPSAGGGPVTGTGAVQPGVSVHVGPDLTSSGPTAYRPGGLAATGVPAVSWGFGSLSMIFLGLALWTWGRRDTRTASGRASGRRMGHRP